MATKPLPFGFAAVAAVAAVAAASAPRCATQAPSPLTARYGTAGTSVLGPSVGGAYGDETSAALNRSNTDVSTLR